MSSSTLSQQFRKKLDDLKTLRSEFLSFIDSEFSEPPDKYDLRTIGSFLHDFYTGSESIFKFIVTKYDREPERLHGEKWHQEILDRMTDKIGTMRPQVITEDLHDQLDEYRAFRHVFREAYGFELKWKYMKPLVESFEPVSNKLISSLEEFDEAME